MPQLCDLQITVNDQHTFFVNEKILLRLRGKLKKKVKQEKKRSQIKNWGLKLKIDDFPGGPDGFELVSRFCYNNGGIPITVSNVSVLHCCAIYLGMDEKASAKSDLLQQTETFLEGMFYWSLNDILVCLKSCESFFEYADSIGLVQKLICSLLAKIAHNSDLNFIISSSSSSSSPETSSGFRFSSSTKTTPESLVKQGPSLNSRVWWFDDLTILTPKIIEKFIRTLGAYGAENNSLIVTKFLLHYLNTVFRRKGHGGALKCSRSEYGGLADTAVYGVVLVGKTSFSCRGLFWVLRVVSGYGLSRDCRVGLERLIGGMLDKATLDDVLVSGHDHGGGVYDVNFVLRLIRVFANNSGSDDDVPLQKMKKVGRLIDMYLREISPDQNLKISKFLGVAESMPDSARDCFDGVYRAVDIYLESHPTLPFEERSRLCRCLNYEKLSLEACKDLAKNPRIPPNIAIQALLSQKSRILAKDSLLENAGETITPPSCMKGSQLVLYNNANGVDWEEDSFSEENAEMKMKLQRMQWRVVELETVCKEMKGQMSRFVRNGSAINRGLPRLCFHTLL